LTAIADLAARFPHLPFVLDHLGWPAADGAPEHGLTTAHQALVEYPNVFLKLTTSNLDAQEKAGRPATEFVRHVVDVYGPDRVLWGSDFGNSPATYSELISRALSATESLTDKERSQVLGATGRALFIRGGAAAGR
jgi:predicted TIM-barrel fold metal-dependent hydrolase